MTVDQIPIGRFSAATRLTQKALRYYDEKGILTPGAKDSITGYRYYTVDQIPVAAEIKTLTELGLTLDETAAFMEAEKRGDTEAAGTIIRRHLERTRDEISRLERVEAMLANCKTEELIKMTLTEPVVKEVPAMRVVSIRAKGTYSATIPMLIGEVMRCIYSPGNQRNFVKIVGPVMTIYHDEEYREEAADLEVVVPVTGKVTASEGVEVRNLPASKVASLIHKGPYETIGPAYGKLSEYVIRSGLKPAGPLMDLYLSDPNSTPKEEIMTEIRMPVA